MAVLEKSLRAKLETTVKNAREVAEKASLAALKQLAVEDAKAPDYLTDAQKDLRRRLRAHGRALGDKRRDEGSQELKHLVWEISYEHWHRMLFARFLAENNLLMWEPGAAVSLDDCRDIIESHPELAMGAKSRWELAGKLAARMLPQVFKPKNPAFEVNFSTEEQRALEVLLDLLPQEVFHASDSLGWVYQFWQSKRKDEVNQSEVKIGADELPAVTQLFTEPYMVEFLLQNSLGAWWSNNYPTLDCPCELPYLRKNEDGSPAAGGFEKWPNSLSDFKLLDPSCGSGHFLVSAFLMLVPMRIRAESIGVKEAINLVLSDNLYGLEIDPRCVEIAVFALALVAWTYLDEDGVQLGVSLDMPNLNIACCGLQVASKADAWTILVPKDSPNAEHLKAGLVELHETFNQASVLGSLLDPSKSNKGSLFSADYKLLEELLAKALSSESQSYLFDEIEDRLESAVNAQGLLGAAKILSNKYDLVITNVPYLARGKQEESLRNYCEKYYPDGKNDLANVFLERCLELSKEDGKGIVQVVMPQNWLFLSAYKKQRNKLLINESFLSLVWLGHSAFEGISGEVVQVILISISNKKCEEEAKFCAMDVAMGSTVFEKIQLLKGTGYTFLSQREQLKNPEGRILIELNGNLPRLGQYAKAWQGLVTGDDQRFVINFWEISSKSKHWEFYQTPPERTELFGGRSCLVRWDEEKGELHLKSKAHNFPPKKILGAKGVAIRQMGSLYATLHNGYIFSPTVAPIIVNNLENLAAIWCFAESGKLEVEARKLNKKVNVTNGTFNDLPIDIDHWKGVALNKYPNGLPAEFSSNPTQWLFDGYPKDSDAPLQVSIARMLGYKWPAELGAISNLSKEGSLRVNLSNKLTNISSSGIVCIPSVRGELPAHEKLLTFLIEAWQVEGSEPWKLGILDQLLANAGSQNMTLEAWLRDFFFEQHIKIFQNRPFIWHIWDGLRDGFGALVNYHKLNAKNFELLIHGYLGDWIRSQELGVVDRIDGAELRLSAALDLKRRLEMIYVGEQPYDIFVRWKSLSEQSIGWNPDINDGIRVNIRPFVEAGVLRFVKKPKFNISWEKDRGKDLVSAPWYKLGSDYGGEPGDRINAHHLGLAEKIKAKNESIL
jgi:hypothetical protein